MEIYGALYLWRFHHLPTVRKDHGSFSGYPYRVHNWVYHRICCNLSIRKCIPASLYLFQQLSKKPPKAHTRVGIPSGLCKQQDSIGHFERCLVMSLFVFLFSAFEITWMKSPTDVSVSFHFFPCLLFPWLQRISVVVWRLQCFQREVRLLLRFDSTYFVGQLEPDWN